MSRYIDAPREVTDKQIKRDMKNIHIYADRKKEVFCNKAIIVLVVLLWIMVICIWINHKASLHDMETQGTYYMPAYVERTTNNGYVLNVDDKIYTYETDRFLMEGQMISVSMDRNGTAETSDDFIAEIH